MVYHPMRDRNRALARYLVLPTLLLTVALLGGLRIDADPAREGALVFIPPPLITLLLAVLLMLLFVRGRLIEPSAWFSSAQTALANVANALTLVALFFASAQAFNSVLPEAGLLRWMFSFFFLWTLWNNQFSAFDARRLLRSLAVLFGTAFVLKHMLLSSLYAPDGGWLKRLTGLLLEGATLGTLDAPAFAPATGYISFFTIALYVAALALILLLPSDVPGVEETEPKRAQELVGAFRRLSQAEQSSVREALFADALATADAPERRALTSRAENKEGEDDSD
jgi:hypothetical protein